MPGSLRLFGAVGIAALLSVAPAFAAPVTPAAPDPADKQGSFYVQCDGQPNNVSGGESAARLLGAVTLLGIFAPAHEAPDASKRKLGAEGVAACTTLIDGAGKEGNPQRRIGLILARAVHQIEDKKYDAALADVALARQEASNAGFTNDRYWMRSRGRSFGQLESVALARMGRAADAQAAALATTDQVTHSIFRLIGTPTYTSFLRTGSPKESAYMAARSHAYLIAVLVEADRLDELGKFAAAATARDALLDFGRTSNPETLGSQLMGQSAIDHALAGERAKAVELATAARANAEKRRGEGKPDADQAAFVETMDLYGILTMMADGDMKGARRLFAARSQWVSVPFGAVLETVKRLRVGAAPDELIGGLARTPDEIWGDRASLATAEAKAQDIDNKSLFRFIEGVESARDYEAISGRVWKTDKSKLIVKTKTPQKGSIAFDLLYLPLVPPVAAMDGYMLHAALLAKARGDDGFTVTPILSQNIVGARIATGKKGAPGFAEPMFNNADEVIADLSQVIPSPETLRLRK